MSSKVDEERVERPAHTTPSFLSTFSCLQTGNDDEGGTTPWNSRLVGYGDDDSDTDEASPSPIEATEGSSNGSPEECDKVTLLEKKIEEMKKAHILEKEKAHKTQDDLEDKIRLKDVKIKVLEKKLGTTSVSKLESSVTVKENETRKLETKLQKVQDEARRRERHLSEQLEEQKVQYKLLKTEASKAKHDLKEKSTKFLELQDGCEKLKKAYNELKGKYDKFVEMDGNSDKHNYKQKYLELQAEVDRTKKSSHEPRDRGRTEADSNNANRDSKEKHHRPQEDYDKSKRARHESHDRCHNPRERETQQSRHKSSSHRSHGPAQVESSRRSSGYTEISSSRRSSGSTEAVSSRRSHASNEASSSSRSRCANEEASSSSRSHGSSGKTTETGMQTEMGDWMKHVDGTVSKVVDSIMKQAEKDMAHRVSQLVTDLDALKNANDSLTLENQQLMKQVEHIGVLQDALEKLQAGCEALTQKYEEAQQAAKQETEKLCQQVIHLQTQLEQAEEAHRHCSDIFIDEAKPELDKLKRKYERLRQTSEEQARALTTEAIKIKNEAKANESKHAMELRKVMGERDRQLQLVKHFTASATHHAEEMARMKQDLKDAKAECAELKQTHEVVVQTVRAEAAAQVDEFKGHIQELYEEVKRLRDRCQTHEATIASLSKKINELSQWLVSSVQRVQAKAQKLREKRCISCSSNSPAMDRGNDCASSQSSISTSSQQEQTTESPHASSSNEGGMQQSDTPSCPPVKKPKLFSHVTI